MSDLRCGRIPGGGGPVLLAFIDEDEDADAAAESAPPTTPRVGRRSRYKCSLPRVTSTCGLPLENATISTPSADAGPRVAGSFGMELEIVGVEEVA